jgi:hypothetical protein
MHTHSHPNRTLQDCLASYGAVFTSLLRMRRVEHALRALYRPLRAQPRSTPGGPLVAPPRMHAVHLHRRAAGRQATGCLEVAYSSRHNMQCAPPPPTHTHTDVVLNEADADRAHRRLQHLRAVHHAAGSLVAALQGYVHARASGEPSVELGAQAVECENKAKLDRGHAARRPWQASRLGLRIPRAMGPPSVPGHAELAAQRRQTTAAPALPSNSAPPPPIPRRRRLGAPAGQAGRVLRGGGADSGRAHGVVGCRNGRHTQPHGVAGGHRYVCVCVWWWWWWWGGLEGIRACLPVVSRGEVWLCLAHHGPGR